jgi:hypothetical protein
VVGEVQEPGRAAGPLGQGRAWRAQSRKMVGLRGGVAMERAAPCVSGRRLRLPHAFAARLPSPPPPAR